MANIALTIDEVQVFLVVPMEVKLLNLLGHSGIPSVSLEGMIRLGPAGMFCPA
jgi:hypothetical protein